MYPGMHPTDENKLSRIGKPIRRLLFALQVKYAKPFIVEGVSFSNKQ